jgi:hypothetical protein
MLGISEKDVIRSDKDMRHTYTTETCIERACGKVAGKKKRSNLGINGPIIQRDCEGLSFMTMLVKNKHNTRG